MARDLERRSYERGKMKKKNKEWLKDFFRFSIIKFIFAILYFFDIEKKLKQNLNRTH